jgi:galactokinase
VPPERVTARGPGRVNLIGEHTDYNLGLCLPFAVERGVTVMAERAEAGIVYARALDLGESDRFALGAVEPASGWRAFVRGVAAELSSAGIELPGARLEISGDLPRGMGLASSAALETALCLALLALAAAAVPEPRELARLCSLVEQRWTGAQTGLLDQLASLLGRPGHALFLDCRDLGIEQVPLDLDGFTLAVLDSGSRPSLAGAESGYSVRRRECAEACRALGVASLREAEKPRAEQLPEPLRGRALHVISENERVLDAVAALRRRDTPALGDLLDASHASLRDRYEVSAPEVEGTVARLKRAGAAGARIMGGGFGGAVLALFPPDVATPEGALPVGPSAGARLLA